MKYLLDTNICILYIRKPNSNAYRRLASTPLKDVAICDVVKMELLYGAYYSTQVQANLATLQTFFSTIKSLPFDGLAADRCAQLRADLRKSGQPIGPYDFQIAAIALANNLTLVTHNVREFSRINSLTIEDWETTP